MSKDLHAARAYGEALFAAVKARGDDMNDVLERVRSTRQALLATPEFVSFVEAPNVPRSHKEELIRGVMDKMGRVLMKNLLLMMLKRGRMDLMMPALRHFQLLAEKELGIARGSVATAKPLSDDEKDRLHKTLQDFTNTRLSITWSTQPDLIGGVMFKSGDLLIDSSLKSQLERLRASLMAPRVH